ncbi:hypothetical protein ACFQGW_02850 [Xanthomonas theicola]|nr:hypothetical protein [Xanthomonas theicola]QNH24449.1 hypothetical protein G4Q83_06325 [Xanthomonas theicola]
MSTKGWPVQFTMTTYKKTLLTCILLSAAGAANCGISERAWHFEPLEEQLFDSTYNQGLETGCESFTARRVSFVISYIPDPRTENRIHVRTNDPGNVVHDKVAKKFYVKDATQLTVGFPSWGAYTIQNVTPGSAVTAHDCDSGIYD